MVLPGFESISICDALVTPTVVLGKVRLVGLKDTMGAVGAVPTPVSGMDCGLPEASSVKVMAPARVPVAVGVKVTFTAQLAREVSVAPHVVVRA